VLKGMGPKKKIAKIIELMSYNSNYDRNYKMKKSFNEYLKNKQSLLLIAKTDEGKCFGAFTEEKLDFEPA
jgi:hypothetical protein